MSPKTLKNVPASIRQRLLNRARADNRPFNELLQYYAMERFLYRLSKSPHAERFILKGALMLRVWRSPEARPTMDIDMLGRTENDEAAIAAQVRDILAVEVEPDGLIFDPTDLRTERIAEAADYEGVRVRFRGLLDSARINMRIDIGFGDALFPGPEAGDMPTVLDLPAARLLCYSRESAIAEKFHAMVSLGELNSRMKDFYDIWLLARGFDFEGGTLAEAIRLTMRKRGNRPPTEIVAFSADFARAKQAQWTAFRRRLGREQIPLDFAEIASAVSGFLRPIALALSSGVPPPDRWTAPGPWLHQ